MYFSEEEKATMEGRVPPAWIGPLMVESAAVAMRTMLSLPFESKGRMSGVKVRLRGPTVLLRKMVRRWRVGAMNMVGGVCWCECF